MIWRQRKVVDLEGLPRIGTLFRRTPKFRRVAEVPPKEIQSAFLLDRLLNERGQFVRIKRFK